MGKSHNEKDVTTPTRGRNSCCISTHHTDEYTSHSRSAAQLPVVRIEFASACKTAARSRACMLHCAAFLEHKRLSPLGAGKPRRYRLLLWKVQAYSVFGFTRAFTLGEDSGAFTGQRVSHGLSSAVGSVVLRLRCHSLLHHFVPIGARTGLSRHQHHRELERVPASSPHHLSTS